MSAGEPASRRRFRVDATAVQRHPQLEAIALLSWLLATADGDHVDAGSPPCLRAARPADDAATAADRAGGER